MPNRWEEVAERLDSLAQRPTEEQRRVAEALGIAIDDDTPAPVTAVILKSRLSGALLENLSADAEIPESLIELEDELDSKSRAQLVTGSRLEVSAWFASRYMQLTANGLRELQPCVGDVVERFDAPGDNLIISSIGDDGRIHMRGGRGKRAWPNHLKLVARADESDTHSKMIASLDAKIRNEKNDYAPSSPRLEKLEKFRITGNVPTDEAIRELEDLLESGEPKEPPFQRLIERHPQLLTSLVIGSWGSYVIPQQKLGVEHVTDFLVLGINSLGPQWVAVELEAPRHQLLTQSGSLRSEVQHAVNQVQDWRDWLTENVAYAHNSLHLHGLTNHVPGLVIVGRDHPRDDRQPARSRVDEQQDIQIHSWDWLLRQAQRLNGDMRGGMEWHTT